MTSACCFSRGLVMSLAALVLLPCSAMGAPENDAVLAPVNAMFAGMSKRDAAAIKAPVVAGAPMIFSRKGKPAQMTIEAFAERIGTPAAGGAAQPAIAETIHDPVIHVDKDLAVVWAPFVFTIDGKVDHCGTDLFSLMMVDGAWRITSITWNSRKDCAGR